jgi:hypothetical protein
LWYVKMRWVGFRAHMKLNSGCLLCGMSHILERQRWQNTLIENTLVVVMWYVFKSRHKWYVKIRSYG